MTNVIRLPNPKAEERKRACLEALQAMLDELAARPPEDFEFPGFSLKYDKQYDEDGKHYHVRGFKMMLAMRYATPEKHPVEPCPCCALPESDPHRVT